MDRKRKKKSAVWQFFKPLDDSKAKCEICKKVISYKSSVTNLRSHLSHTHKTVILIPPTWKKESEDGNLTIRNANNSSVRLEQVNIKDDFNWGGDTQWSLVPVIENQDISPQPCETQVKIPKKNRFCDSVVVGTSSTTDAVESDVAEVGTSAHLNKRIKDSAMLRLFITDFQPYSIVSDRGFKDFVKELDPNYELPSQEKISECFIPNLHQNCLIKAKEIVQNVTKVCLTADLCALQHGGYLLAVTGHFINENFDLKSVVLDCFELKENFSSKEVVLMLGGLIEKWNLKDKIQLAVSSNQKVLAEAFESGLNVKHFGYFTDLLNTDVGDSLSIYSITELLNKVRRIVSFINESSQMNENLLTFQRSQRFSPLKILVTDNPSQWITTFYMLKIFIELKEGICGTLKEAMFLHEDEWVVLKELVKILQPFEAVTKIISTENFKVASYITVITKGLIEGCVEIQSTLASQGAKLFCKFLLSAVRSRFSNLECSDMIGITTYLDPRFKEVAFPDQDSEERIRGLIIKQLNEAMRVEVNEKECVGMERVETDSPFKYFDQKARHRILSNSQHNRGEVEMQQYINEHLLTRDKNPLEWWRSKSCNYPYLSQIAREYLCVVATSFLAELSYVEGGVNKYERLRRLPSETAKQMACLHVNSKLMDGLLMDSMCV